MHELLTNPKFWEVAGTLATGFVALLLALAVLIKAQAEKITDEVRHHTHDIKELVKENTAITQDAADRQRQQNCESGN